MYNAIKRDINGKIAKNEVFFHRSALDGGNFDTLEEGTGVEFNVEQGPKGPRAVKIKILNA
ncbi:MAG: cold shock domain-containing protein [Candidatus Omnitrophica bacterium]|nr:cold shock domain-containing protein [Candidatus Omnitrophota bacterium]